MRNEPTGASRQLDRLYSIAKRIVPTRLRGAPLQVNIGEAMAFAYVRD